MTGAVESLDAIDAERRAHVLEVIGALAPRAAIVVYFAPNTDRGFLDAVTRTAACAAAERPGQSGTWITPAIVDAYCELHAGGFAHSVEAWHEGRLVGGLYGVALGRMFFGESMFAAETDASKVALVHLVGLLRARGFPLIDCQQQTAHLASFGARAIPRATFAERLAGLVHCPAPAGAWMPLPAWDVLA